MATRNRRHCHAPLRSPLMLLLLLLLWLCVQGKRTAAETARRALAESNCTVCLGWKATKREWTSIVQFTVSRTQKHLFEAVGIEPLSNTSAFRVGMLILDESSNDMTEEVRLSPPHSAAHSKQPFELTTSLLHSCSARTAPPHSTSTRSGPRRARSSFTLRRTKTPRSSKRPSCCSKPPASCWWVPSAAQRSTSSHTRSQASFVPLTPAPSLSRTVTEPTDAAAQPPYVSFTASGVTLNDVNLYPMFHRVSPSDSIQVDAITAMLKKLKVTVTSLVVISDASGMYAMSLLCNSLHRAGIVVAKRTFFSPSLRSRTNSPNSPNSTDTTTLRKTVCSPLVTTLCLCAV